MYGLESKCKQHQILTWYLGLLFCGCTNSCLNAIYIWAISVREKILLVELNMKIKLEIPVIQSTALR